MFLRATCNLDRFHLKKIKYNIIPGIVIFCLYRRLFQTALVVDNRGEVELVDTEQQRGLRGVAHLRRYQVDLLFGSFFFILGFCFAYRLATVVLLVQPHPRLFSLLVVDDGGVVSKVKSVALLVQHEGVGVVKEGLRLQRLKNLKEKKPKPGGRGLEGSSCSRVAQSHRVDSTPPGNKGTIGENGTIGTIGEIGTYLSTLFHLELLPYLTLFVKNACL